MQTSIYEADVFSGRRGKALTTVQTDYRFEKNDEFTLAQGGDDIRLRVTHVRLRIDGSTITRDVTCLKL